MNKRIGAALLALVLTAGGTLVASAAVQGHTGDLKVTAKCNTATGQYDLTAALTISRTDLAGTASYRVGTASFDGTPASAAGMTSSIPVNGSGTYPLTSFSLPGSTTGFGPWVYAHTTWSDGYKQGSDGQLTSRLAGDCKPPVVTVTVPDLVALPPTCDTAGTLPFLGNPAAQNPNGYEFPGQGFRVYLDRAYTAPTTVPLSYTLTFQKVGAGFDAAFPGGTKVVGNTSQTLTVLPPTGYQTADQTLPCYNRPDVPDPRVVVTYDEWVDGDGDCETETVEQTRTATTTTTYSIWDEATKAYVLDTANPLVETVTETKTRTFNDTEWIACQDDPQPDVVFTEWVKGSPLCGATTVEATRTATTTPRVWEGRELVLDVENAVTVVETQTVPVAEVTLCSSSLAHTGDESVLVLVAALLLVFVGVPLATVATIHARRQ